MGKDGQKESVCSFRLNSLAEPDNSDPKQFVASIPAIPRLSS